MSVKKEKKEKLNNLLEIVKKILDLDEFKVDDAVSLLPHLQYAYDEYDEFINNNRKCQCKAGMDVRVMCEPECKTKNSLRQFQKCPMRLSTMDFWICNQQDLYEKAMKYDFTFLRKYGLSNEDDSKIIKEFIDENILLNE